MMLQIRKSVAFLEQDLPILRHKNRQPVIIGLDHAVKKGVSIICRGRQVGHCVSRRRE